MILGPSSSRPPPPRGSRRGASVIFLLISLSFALAQVRPGSGLHTGRSLTGPEHFPAPDTKKAGARPVWTAPAFFYFSALL